MPKNIAMDGISCAKSYLDIVFQTFCEHKIVILHYTISIIIATFYFCPQIIRNLESIEDRAYC